MCDRQIRTERRDRKSPVKCLPAAFTEQLLSDLGSHKVRQGEAKNAYEGRSEHTLI